MPLAVTSNEVQIEQPEAGAEFQVYLASAGSYENAKESERDILLTDSYGFAQSKSLPYGLYVVHQTAGAEGQKFVPDFSVFISEHGKTYYFILNNPTFTSLIRFEKRDAESGEIIPLAGTSVKIRNADTGEWVVQHINYPSPMDIDTFVTDSTGTLMLPEALGFGNYELYEQQSPWGYVLDDEPVPFVVDGTQDVVTVTKYNTVQKGTITIHKEGEVFSHVVEAGGLYQPQYEVQGQPGAVYDITALEDIVTPDGVVHAKAGELVATLTTGSDGTATSEPLYLGRYQVSERTAPAGMVLDTEPKEVTLAYAGQEVSVTTADVGFVNVRQKVIPANPLLGDLRKRKRKLRVAAYCRVSTEEEEQQNSFEVQVAYYTDKITHHEGWQLAGIFADDGISGVSTKKREQFNKMIELCRKKKIDLILTKSISRFARNTLDCIKHVRILKSWGIPVIFEKENIDTSNMNSEMILTCLSSFAQAESESISGNVTKGIRMGYRQGRFSFRYKNFLGYRKGPDGEPEIVPEEAKIIRLIAQNLLLFNQTTIYISKITWLNISS